MSSCAHASLLPALFWSCLLRANSRAAQPARRRLPLPLCPSHLPHPCFLPGPLQTVIIEGGVVYFEDAAGERSAVLIPDVKVGDDGENKGGWGRAPWAALLMLQGGGARVCGACCSVPLALLALALAAAAGRVAPGSSCPTELGKGSARA